MSSGSTTEAPAANEAPQTDTFVMGHLSEMTSNLVADGPSPANVYRRLFDTINEHYRPLVSKIDTAAGDSQLKASYESPKLTGTSLIEIGSIAVAETLAEALVEQSPVFRINNLDAAKKYVTIGIPIRDAQQSTTIGAISVALVPRTQADINALTAELNSLVLAASGCADTQTPKSTGGQANADWARVLTRVAKLGNGLEFAFTLVNTIADRFECNQVAMGMVNRRVVDVRAISGLSTFKGNSPGVADMRQAMCECLDHDGLVSACRESAEDQRPLPIHRNWSQQNNSSVASVPIQVDKETLAIITLTRSADKPFTGEDLAKLDRMLQPFGPPLKMIEKSGRSLLQHLRDEGRSIATPWLRPKSLVRKGILVAVTLAALWFCFGSMTYTPSCETVLTPASLNHMAAPFDSRIDAVHCLSGDHVKAGQVLLKLDDRDLRLERKQLIAQLNATEVLVGKAISERDAPSAAMAQAEVQVLRSQLETVNGKIERCTLRAPQDGLIVKADLQKHIGHPLLQGDPLITFSPGDAWQVELQVPDSISPYVFADQLGTFRSYAHPEQSLDFKVRNVGASAQVVEGKNVFIAEASLDETRPWMKDGLRGVGRVSSVKKPVWWVTLHGALDYLQMRFWL